MWLEILLNLLDNLSYPADIKIGHYNIDIVIPFTYIELIKSPCLNPLERETACLIATDANLFGN